MKLPVCYLAALFLSVSTLAGIIVYIDHYWFRLTDRLTRTRYPDGSAEQTLFMQYDAWQPDPSP